MVTDHRNHAVDPLDKAADHEKAKIVAGTELMKEKGKICGDVFREIEQQFAVWILTFPSPNEKFPKQSS